jgi:hypothetical protein
MNIEQRISGKKFAPESAPKARSIPAQGNALGHETTRKTRAESPLHSPKYLIRSSGKSASDICKRFLS